MPTDPHLSDDLWTRLDAYTAGFNDSMSAAFLKAAGVEEADPGMPERLRLRVERLVYEGYLP